MGDDAKAQKAHSLWEWWREHGSLTKKQWAFAQMLLNHFYAGRTKQRKLKETGKQYYLYAISDQKSVKLGFSLDPSKRTKQLQVGHPRYERRILRIACRASNAPR